MHLNSEKEQGCKLVLELHNLGLVWLDELIPIKFPSIAGDHMLPTSFPCFMLVILKHHNRISLEWNSGICTILYLYMYMICTIIRAWEMCKIEHLPLKSLSASVVVSTSCVLPCLFMGSFVKINVHWDNMLKATWKGKKKDKAIPVTGHEGP
jgi:hypothetical protein